MNKRDLTTMVAAYIECALWSSNDESREDGGDPLDKNYDYTDVGAQLRRVMTEDCEKFAKENEATLRAAYEACERKNAAHWKQVGHDFWLNRNGHGCGFWETPDWPEKEGAILDTASKAFGTFHLYVGDDGKIHGAHG